MKVMDEKDVRSLSPTLLDLKASRHAATVTSFFETTIEPVCRDIASRLAQVESHSGQGDAWHELRLTQMVSHQSFAMMLASLWERAFAEHLSDLIRTTLSSTEDRKEHDGFQRQIKTGGWRSFEQAFVRVHGFEMALIPMFEELKILHLLCSVLRHGEGDSAKILRKKADWLFMKEAELRDIWDYFLESVEEFSVGKLDIRLEHLARFRDVVVAYWDMIDSGRFAPSSEA
ncbi:hypothetical protein WG901_13130 [Novosphingobium sp. PS1R-30]|uniref:Thiaminase-2/PQQC domain-containing protein n=1 Tax=Novosphingobium anseongense TaxID=3133436 RepID=A0ABU8RY33_9SPHN